MKKPSIRRLFHFLGFFDNKFYAARFRLNLTCSRPPQRFRDNAHRLYHWAADRAIPADNNFAERELRKRVIARKVSFGSQSEAGAKTREILMTTLFTLRKRKAGDVMTNFKTVLDELARDPRQNPYQILFSPNSS